MKTILVAIIVALVASAGTATATSYINGKQIKPGTIAANRLTKKARASLHSTTYAVGAPGATGPQGPQGVQGATGPQGMQGPKGDTGAAGSSVTATALTDEMGANGPCTIAVNGNYGSKFESASGTTYACTGPPGQPGPTGLTPTITTTTYDCSAQTQQIGPNFNCVNEVATCLGPAGRTFMTGATAYNTSTDPVEALPIDTAHGGAQLLYVGNPGTWHLDITCMTVTYQ